MTKARLVYLVIFASMLVMAFAFLMRPFGLADGNF